MLFPLVNPDLFWHLSAGDWILAHRALPRADFLTYAKRGAPWQDFEWLSQAVFAAVYSGLGMRGLWLLKALLLAASWFFVDRAVAENGVLGAGRAAAAAVFFALALGAADIRPELFSLLFFCALLSRLEAWRLGRLKSQRLELLALAAGFSVWADCHAGFFFGLALIGCYALAEALGRRWKQAARAGGMAFLALLASAANPYFLGPHEVAWEHWRRGGDLSRLIAEWRPMTADNPVYWPFWGALALTAVLLTLRLVDERRRPPLAGGCAAAAAISALGALAHKRLGVFFAAPAALLIVLLMRERDWLRNKAVGALAAAAVIFSIWLAPRVRWGVFNDKFVPVRAAGFLSGQREAFQPLRAYEPSGWGGYLGWRLPWFAVYNDGRYLFHDEMALAHDALEAGPREWAAFLDANGFSAAVLWNLDRSFPTTRRYPDGSTKPFLRPWYLAYMPRRRWALVYWDDQTLIFVDRRAAAPAWLSAHEYLYVRPKDDEAFADARARKELPEDVIAAELIRHRAETSL